MGFRSIWGWWLPATAAGWLVGTVLGQLIIDPLLHGLLYSPTLPPQQLLIAAEALRTAKLVLVANLVGLAQALVLQRVGRDVQWLTATATDSAVAWVVTMLPGYPHQYRGLVFPAMVGAVQWLLVLRGAGDHYGAWIAAAVAASLFGGVAILVPAIGPNPFWNPSWPGGQPGTGWPAEPSAAWL